MITPAGESRLETIDAASPSGPSRLAPSASIAHGPRHLRDNELAQPLTLAGPRRAAAGGSAGGRGANFGLQSLPGEPKLYFWPGSPPLTS